MWTWVVEVEVGGDLSTVGKFGSVRGDLRLSRYGKVLRSVVEVVEDAGKKTMARVHVKCCIYAIRVVSLLNP